MPGTGIFNRDRIGAILIPILKTSWIITGIFLSE